MHRSNWKLHELISVPHCRSRALTSVLKTKKETSKKSLLTLFVLAPNTAAVSCRLSPKQLFVSCPVRLCH